MNLRKSVRHCNENDRLLFKNLSSERKKKEVLSKKKSRGAFPETPRKCDSHTELGGLNRITEMVSSIATSTPITSTVKQKGLRSSFQLDLFKTTPCVVTLTPIKILNKLTNSDQVSLHKNNSVNKKVSQMSLVTPIQPLNRTINTRMDKSNISNMTLRSHHSQKKSYPESCSLSSLSQYSSHEEPVSTAKTARSRRQSTNGSPITPQSQYSSNEDQIVLTRVKSLRKSTGSQDRASHVHCKKASSKKTSKHSRKSSVSVNKSTSLSSKKSSSLNLLSLRSKKDLVHESSSSHELTSSSPQYLPNKKQVMTRKQSLRKSTSSQDGTSHVQRFEMFTEKTSEHCRKPSAPSSKQKNKKSVERKVQEPDQQKTPARYNTFSGNIPIDDLLLGWKSRHSRKTKSESKLLICFFTNKIFCFYFVPMQYINLFAMTSRIVLLYNLNFFYI